MFQNLQNLGWGLVGFALIIGIGTVILHEFGGAVVSCPVYGGNQSIYNSTQDACGLVENGTRQNGSYITPTSTAWVNTNFLITELGSTGLAGWVPAIIAVSVGMLLFGAFLIGNSGDRKY